LRAAAINAVFGSASLVQRSPAQTAERRRTVAEGSAGTDQIADASSVEARVERRDGEAGKTREL